MKLWIVVCVIALAVLQGCATVSPWQRGNLAKTEMSWSHDPLEASLDSHIYFAKEASAGGGSAAGGGCGCN